jgi:hypothetical protein
MEMSSPACSDRQRRAKALIEARRHTGNYRIYFYYCYDHNVSQEEPRAIDWPDAGRHHGEGEHDKRNVTMPAMPGSSLVMVEPKLVLGGL